MENLCDFLTFRSYHNLDLRSYFFCPCFSEFYTSDASEACIFISSLDTLNSHNLSHRKLNKIISVFKVVKYNWKMKRTGGTNVILFIKRKIGLILVWSTFIFYFISFINDQKKLFKKSQHKNILMLLKT